MRNKKIAGTMIVGLFFFLLCCSASVQAAQMSVVPEYQEVSTGETFTVEIYVDPEGNETFGAQYLLHFNNTLLNATSQVNGTFLSQDGAETYIYSNVINNTLGQLRYAEIRRNVATGVITPDVLTTITFQAIAEEEGVNELRLDLVKLIDTDSQVIPTNTNNGNVSVRTGIEGDVDNDGYITGGDATKVWDVATGVQPDGILDNPWAADVDCDTYITGGDATKVWDVATGVQPASILNCC